jgi:predicted negative regulator of RcsB-dependent stress response
VEIYETEEEQVAALKAWWKENSQSAVIGLGLGIALIFGWNFWQDYQKDQANQASALYSQLLKAAEANNADSVQKLAEKLRAEFKNTDYAGYSGLMEAKIKAMQGDITGAKVLLEQVAADSDKEIRNIATIRRVRLMMANKEYEQGLAVINAIDPASTASFSGEYDELTGDLYLALDRPDQARTSYQSALRNGLQSPLLAMKIDDLTLPEKVETKK